MINGVVFTFDSIPLTNAKIKVKSSKQEVESDTTGRFTVECTSNDVLFISARGFNSKKVKLSENLVNINTNLTLKPGDKNRELAIRNGHINNKESFNAIANVNQNNEDFLNYANIYEIIQGRFTGVQIEHGEIIIRGINRMQLGGVNNGALIVVDGVIRDKSILSTISTSLVKSIKVMKGGSNAILWI